MGEATALGEDDRSNDAACADNLASGLQREAALALAARVAILAAGATGVAAIGGGPVAVGGLTGLVIFAIVAGWAAWRGGRHPLGVTVADALAAGGACALVSWAGSGVLGTLGVLAAIPLVLVAALDRGAPAGIWVSASAVGASVIGALVADHASAAAVDVAAVPVVAWTVWAGLAARAARRAAFGVDARVARLRSEMVTTVSHELRTPLTVIQAATATLSTRWDLLSEPERMDLVDVLIDNVASLDSSILHFADAARLERGTFDIAPGWVNVEAALGEVRTKLSSILAGRDINAELPVREVWADRRAVARILEHLLVNAARFSPMGLPISVRCVVEGPEAILSVSDRGKGIPAHLRSTVWMPLGRGGVADTGVSRGAGLGLPIVRELARLHGGDADLITLKGRGTTVRVRLPQPTGTIIDQLHDLPRIRRRRRRTEPASGGSASRSA